MLNSYAQFGTPAAVRQTPSGPYGTALADRNASFVSRTEKQNQIVESIIGSQPSFADSVFLQTHNRAGFDPRALSDRLDRKSDIASRLRQSMHEEMEAFLFRYVWQFEAIVENEINNIDFYHGYQWSDKQIKEIQDSFLVPHVSNMMIRWGRTLIGEERGAETVFTFEQDDPAFKDIADLYTQVVRRICRKNKWGRRSSEQFFNGVVGGRGFASVKLDPYDPTRSVLMQNEHPGEFMYDIENAMDGSLDGCNYLMRSYYKDLEEILFLYPEFSYELSGFDFQSYVAEHKLSFTLKKPKVQPPSSKRHLILPTKLQNHQALMARRAAWVTEFYRRGGLRQYAVRDAVHNIDHDFDTVEQAADFYRNLRDFYYYQSLALTGQEGIDMVAPPTEVVRRVLDQETWVGDVLVDVKTQRTSAFPYVAFHPEMRSGEIRGYFQDDKGPSMLRNRFMILLDAQAGAAKGKMVVNKRLFPKGTRAQDMEAMVNSPTKTLIGNWDPAKIDPRNLMVNIGGPQHDALAGTIMQFVNDQSAFANGGLNFVGDAEFAGQSDKLRRGLQVSAQSGTVPVFADWNETEEQVARLTAWNSMSLHPVALLEYCNVDARQRFQPLLQQGEHQIDLDMINIDVTDQVAGPSELERQKADMREIGQQLPELWADMADEYFDMSNLPQERIDRIKAHRDARAQAESEAAQREQQRIEFDTEKKWDIAEKRVGVEEFVAQTKRNPPILTSFQYKADAPGPMIEASILAQNGIGAEPDLVAASHAQHILISQDAANMQQEQFSIRDLAYQKQMAKIQQEHPRPTAGGKSTGAGQGKQAVMSPKNKNARANKGPEKSRH